MLGYPPIKQMPSLARVETRFQLVSMTPGNRQHCPTLGDWGNEVRGYSLCSGKGHKAPCSSSLPLPSWLIGTDDQASMSA